VYPHIGDLTNLAEYPPLKPNNIFCDYLHDHNLSLRMDYQFKEDCKMVPRLKISSISPKEKVFGTYLISIISLPEDEQTSKHGGGGTYNKILEFKGEQIKNNEKEEKKKKMRKICMRKRKGKKCEYE
jgi:hypothetical protein